MEDDSIRTSILSGIRTQLIGFLGLTAISGFLAFLIPTLTANVFDRAVPSGDSVTLKNAVLALLVTLISLQLVELSAAFLRLHVRKRLSLTWKATMMRRLLRLPIPFFREFAVGDLLSRLGLVHGEQERLIFSISTGVVSALFSTSSLVYLFWQDGRTGLLAAAAGGSVLGVAWILAARKLPMERCLIISAGRLRCHLIALFAAIAKVRVARAENRLFRQWKDRLGEKQKLGFASERLNGLLSVWQSVVPALSIAMFFLVFTDGTGAGTPGRYLATLSAFTLFMEGVFRLAAALFDAVVAIPLFERAKPLFQRPLEQSRNGDDPGKLTGHVQLKNVSHRFSPDGPLVLSDINLDIPPGSFVALVGPSGSGKSTLMRLLLGFEQPTEGDVLYDGKPLSSLALLQVRRQCGTVLQQDHLIAGNIFENIAAMRPITLEQAWEAARIAGMSEELQRLPMGMRSFVTQGGSAFSGGERQRLMIARAVAGQPRILFLDEATSALDNRVQAEIMRNLELLRVTRIFVAHRLSTIRQADRIFVLEQGRVVDSGSFDSLVAREGTFERMVRRQSA